jgi:hypothetical protein
LDTPIGERLRKVSTILKTVLLGYCRFEDGLRGVLRDYINSSWFGAKKRVFHMGAWRRMFCRAVRKKNTMGLFFSIFVKVISP